MALKKTEIEGAAALLRAGALVLPAAKLPSDEPSDGVSARTYAHPALGARVVVRLASDPLAPSDDLEAELLGFGAPRVHAGLARRRRRALGFPGWALVHDPKQARYALEVVKELKKAARVAKSKPGHAKEAFDAIGKRLARSVPQFLPSFYEEAGRAFIEVGNLGFAASTFAKAREAEKVHALKVEPEARQTAFLEFALAGAITGKALSEYASELAKGSEAEEAFALFRELCVKRILGGMPPWSGMGKDLKRLGKAARLDLAGEDSRLIEEILEAPALARAPGEFWSTYSEAIVRLGKASDAVKAAMLRLNPEASGDRAAFAITWIGLLEEMGAVAGLTAPRANASPELAGLKPGAWFTRMVSLSSGYRSPMPQLLFTLLRRLAPRLIEEGEPVVMEHQWGRLDLDLLDLALELKIPVAETKNGSIDLRDWATLAAANPPERGRDPVHVTADPRFSPMIDAALNAAFGQEPFETQARGKRGLFEARRKWIEQSATRLLGQSLEGFLTQLNNVSHVASAKTFVEFPSAREMLLKADVAAALAKTLRDGVLDELGWPAMEEAVAELVPAGSKAQLQVLGSFPHLLLVNDLKVIVLGPSGRLLTHDVRLPKGGRLQELAFAGGQLRVAFWDGKSQAYWSGSPDTLFEVPYLHSSSGFSVELEDGGVTCGGRALHVGDTEGASFQVFMSDGRTFWRRESIDNEWAFKEFDPTTGVAGRRSLPTFLEEFIVEGEKLELAHCSLLPAPKGMTSSLLGLKGGLIGLRVRRDKGGVLTFEGIDGRRFRSGASQNVPEALISFPGHEAPLPISSSWRGAAVHSADGARTLFTIQVGERAPLFAKGTALCLPILFWHFLSPRDEAGSKALRAVTTEMAKAMIDAVGPDATRLTAAIRAALPQLVDARLLSGIEGIVREARHGRDLLSERHKAWDPAQAPVTVESTVPEVGDDQILEAIAGIAMRVGHIQGSGLEELTTVARLMEKGLAGTEPVRLEDAGQLPWEWLAGNAGALAFVAAAPTMTAASRLAICALIETMAATPLLEAKEHRHAHFTLPSNSTYFPKDSHNPVVAQKGDSVWFLRKTSWSEPVSVSAFERATDGKFQLLPGATLVSEERPTGRLSKEKALGFAKRLRTETPALLPEAVAELSRRTGLTRAEATLLWAGFPRIATYGNDFLGKERREALDLKVSEANAAKATLSKVPLEARIAMFCEAVGNDPDALFSPLGAGPSDDGSPIAKLAAAWNQRIGKRVQVPDELLLATSKELPNLGIDPGAMFSAIAEPSACEPLNHDGKFSLREDGHLVAVAKTPGVATWFTEGWLRASALYVPHVFQATPVGDPLRAQLGKFLELVRARLQSPDLLVEGGNRGFYDTRIPSRRRWPSSTAWAAPR